MASGLDVEGVRRLIGADSLGYVTPEGLVTASEQPGSRLCTARFDGDYPIPLPRRRGSASTCWKIRRSFERTPFVDVSGSASGDPGPVSAGWGAAEALERP